MDRFNSLLRGGAMGGTQATQGGVSRCDSAMENKAS